MMLPSAVCQRSNASTADQLQFVDAHHRLIVKFELAAFDGLTQVLFDLEAGRGGFEQFRTVDIAPIATGFFRSASAASAARSRPAESCA